MTMKPWPTHDSQDFWNASPFNSYVERRGAKIAKRKAAKAQRAAQRLESRGHTKAGFLDERLTEGELKAAAHALPADAESGWMVFFTTKGYDRPQAVWVPKFRGIFSAHNGSTTRIASVRSLLPQLWDGQADAASGLL